MKSRRATNFVLALLLVCAGLLGSFAVAATAPAQTADTTDTTTTGTEPTTTAPYVIPAGVTIGGVSVAGMNTTMAQATVESFFSSPLTLQIGTAHVALHPDAVGADANVDGALLAAESAQPGQAIPLSVTVDHDLLLQYVNTLVARYDHPVVDAQVLLRHMRPFVTDGKRGEQLQKTASFNAIRTAFKTNRRFVLNLSLKWLPRRVTKVNVGPVIVIRRGSNRLYLYNGSRFVRRFSVATGQSIYPTPLGRFEIIVKHRNPWWYPPNSPWAAGKKPVPPGPGNPLGTRWMGLSAPGVGIHGTPESSSIGYSLSHGCIRMYIPDAEWLFNHVNVGTPVFIIPQ